MIILFQIVIKMILKIDIYKKYFFTSFLKRSTIDLKSKNKTVFNSIYNEGGYL